MTVWSCYHWVVANSGKLYQIFIGSCHFAPCQVFVALGLRTLIIISALDSLRIRTLEDNHDKTSKLKKHIGVSPASFPILPTVRQCDTSQAKSTFSYPLHNADHQTSLPIKTLPGDLLRPPLERNECNMRTDDWPKISNSTSEQRQHEYTSQ